MSSSTSVIGRNGKFVVASSRVGRVKQWVVNRKLASESAWGDSDSSGYTNRAAGRFDATFTSEGVYDTSSEVFDLFKPGDIALAALWMNATTLYWAFPRALNSDFQLTVNIDSQEVIGWTSSWGADGEFYHPGESGAPSYTLP